MNKSDLVVYLNAQKRLLNRAYTCNMLNEYSVATSFGDILKGDNIETMRQNLSGLGYSVNNLSYKDGLYSLEAPVVDEVVINLPEVEVVLEEDNDLVEEVQEENELDLSQFEGLRNNRENRQKIKDYAEKEHNVILKGNKSVETFMQELKEAVEV